MSQGETLVRYLMFDLSESGEGVITLDAMASTPADRNPEVMAEVRQVLDWAWQRFAHSHGPVDEGMDWDHDLQVNVEDGSWHTVTLTLSCSQRFADEFLEVFGDSENT